MMEAAISGSTMREGIRTISSVAKARVMECATVKQVTICRVGTNFRQTITRLNRKSK